MVLYVPSAFNSKLLLRLTLLPETSRHSVSPFVQSVSFSDKSPQIHPESNPIAPDAGAHVVSGKKYVRLLLPERLSRLSPEITTLNSNPTDVEYPLSSSGDSVANAGFVTANVNVPLTVSPATIFPIVHNASVGDTIMNVPRGMDFPSNATPGGTTIFTTALSSVLYPLLVKDKGKYILSPTPVISGISLCLS